MLHRFVFQKKARLQFQNICDYIDGEFGVRIADEFVYEVELCIASVMKFPESGHPEFKIGKYHIRSKIVGRYNKMYYFLQGNTLVITAFADMRMHPDKIQEIVMGKR